MTVLNRFKLSLKNWAWGIYSSLDALVLLQGTVICMLTCRLPTWTCRFSFSEFNTLNFMLVWISCPCMPAKLLCRHMDSSVLNWAYTIWACVKQCHVIVCTGKSGPVTYPKENYFFLLKRLTYELQTYQIILGQLNLKK